MTAENHCQKKIAEILSDAKQIISLEELLDLEGRGKVKLTTQRWTGIQEALADEIKAVIPRQLVKDLDLTVGRWQEVAPRGSKKLA